MISKGFQILLIITMVMNLIITIILIRKREMRVKYSLVWVFISIFALILAIFPNFFRTISNMLFIYNDANALFMIGIGILYVLSFSFSIMFSRNSFTIKNLTQEIAMLKSRINELENLKDD